MKVFSAKKLLADIPFLETEREIAFARCQCGEDQWAYVTDGMRFDILRMLGFTLDPGWAVDSEDFEPLTAPLELTEEEISVGKSEGMEFTNSKEEIEEHRKTFGEIYKTMVQLVPTLN